MSSWDRVMAAFRKKDGERNLTAYAEPPLTMMRQMIHDQAPDDFDEWLE